MFARMNIVESISLDDLAFLERSYNFKVLDPIELALSFGSDALVKHNLPYQTAFFSDKRMYSILEKDIASLTLHPISHLQKITLPDLEAQLCANVFHEAKYFQNVTSARDFARDYLLLTRFLQGL